MAKGTPREERRVIGVTLELSTDEAELLADTLAKIGGIGQRRQLANGISLALREAGIKAVHELEDYSSREAEDLSGTITVNGDRRLDPAKVGARW